jgi:hypothetical protein
MDWNHDACDPSRDKYEAGFSAENEISEEDLRNKMEREMYMMGIWDAVGLG